MLPSTLAAELTSVVGGPPVDIRGASGGCINRAAFFAVGSARFFVKWNQDAPAGMFEAEAAGLTVLRDAAAVDVAEPLHVGGGERVPPYLLMRDFGSGAPRQGHDARFGEGLAALHRTAGGAFGLDHDNFIGTLPQRNDQGRDWPSFFGERRIGDQQAIAARSGALPASALRRLDRLRQRLPSLLPSDPVPARLHGDLWSGNYAVSARGEAIIFDPAVYFGDREVELAFTELFGGFSRRFYDAYDATWPIVPGYEERRDLYNLYPLLVHANLFGGHYARQVDAVASRYA